MTRISKELTHLEAVGLIKLAQTHPELEFMFRHALVQEAAYNSLLLEDRKKLHRQVGEAIERTYSDRLEELASTLADHFVKAEEIDKAVHYLILAGDKARDLHAHQEAINHYQQALELLKEQEDYDQAARTQMKLGLTFHNAFDFQQARQAYEAGFALWQQAGEVKADSLSPAPHALRLAWDDPVTLDPTRTHDVPSLSLEWQLFSGLATTGSDLDIAPEVAHSWEILEEGRKYIFHLRDDVHWSDGISVMAADFEYAWKRALDPADGSSLASQLYEIKGARAFHQGEMVEPDGVGVHALDPVTLVVEMEKPSGNFLYRMAWPLAFPVPRHIVTKYGDVWATPETIVTNGPFKLESWRPGEQMLLLRNPTYHGRYTGNVQRVELILRDDWPDRVELYEAGNLDSLALPLMSVTDHIRQQHPGEYVSLPPVTTRSLGLVVSQPPFDDPRVRRAFALAIDRETYADEVAKGIVAPATGGFLPPGIPGHSAGIGLPYDPDRARQLLAEAGYPAGENFPAVEWLVEPGQETLAEYLQVQWREKLGVELSWEAPERTELFARLYKQTPPMYLLRWSVSHPDPDYFTRIFIEVERLTNPWQSESFDKLVEEARRITDQKARMKLYRQADRILVEEVPIIPLVYEPNHLLVKPWVRKYPIAANAMPYFKDVIIEPH